MTAPQPWPPSRLCPATSNLPTRMLSASWQALCAAMQRREAVGASRGKGGMAPEDFAAISAARFPCAVCAGQALPPGLELITQEEAEQMARTTKRGTCDLCGASSNVGTNHGSKVCTNCTHVQSALSKRPQSVAKAIRAMGKTEEMLSALIPAGGGIAVKVTADLLQEISGIVGYDGEDPAELVEAVRKRVLTCASCEAEDVLHEIREIVGYTPEQEDRGLADAVRWLQAKASSVMDCAECDASEALLEIAELVGKRGESSGLVVEAVRIAVIGACADCTSLKCDLLQACELDLDLGTAQGWGYVAAASIQTIAELENRNIFIAQRREDLLERLALTRQETESLREIGESQLAKLRAELTLVTQSRDEWEQRAVQTESNVETLEAELRNREDAPAAPCASTTYLLDIALRALRGEGPDADQLATIIDAARRAA